MLNLKKTAVAVLALGSSAVFAGTMGPVCTPGNVTVPCERSGWDVGVAALYLQPNHTGSWAYANATPAVAPATGTVFNRFNYDWDWGFRVDASYHFSTGNDITVNWSELDSKTNGVYAAGVVVTPAFPAGLNFQTKDKWDAINLEVGQMVDVSANSKVRLHGGMEFVQIKSSLNNFLLAGTPAVGVLGNDFSKFKGLGPRTGIDMGYMFGNGFGVYAKGAAAVLIGETNFNSGINPVANTFAFNGPKANTVVPSLEGKLGAMYTYAMASGDLSLDAGYMWVDYINAMRKVQTNTTGAITGVPTNPAPGVAGLTQLVTSDFSVNGPYVGFKYVGNM